MIHAGCPHVTSWELCEKTVALSPCETKTSASRAMAGKTEAFQLVAELN